MKHGIHFLSGLPRSGSTLLSALLRQNPRFSAGITSPVASLYVATQLALSSKNEFHLQISDRQRAAVLRGIFENFYADVHEDKIVFDTNRAWCGKLNALARLFPSCKVLCCVRSIAWVLDSLERLAQANALEPSRIYNFDQNGSVYTRAEMLTAPGGLVRAAHDGLMEAFLGENSHRLLLIQYESLARAPEATLSAIYRFLGEDPFIHDLENVSYDADEYDRLTGSPGLHRVRKLVEYRERPTILPPDVFARFDKKFWSDQRTNIRNVQIV